LLSGVYFSLDAAPAWLQKTADLLPLTPLLKSLRAVFNDGAGLASQGPSILIMAVWTVVLFILAARRFKWV
jgi:ABC-2 type transport system permease protein